LADTLVDGTGIIGTYNSKFSVLLLSIFFLILSTIPVISLHPGLADCVAYSVDHTFVVDT